MLLLNPYLVASGLKETWDLLHQGLVGGGSGNLLNIFHVLVELLEVVRALPPRRLTLYFLQGIKCQG